MYRLTLFLPLLVACPAPTDPPPSLPTPRTDLPPSTPVAEICDLPNSELAFSPSWSPLTFAPLPPSPNEQTYTGQITIPLSLHIPLTDVTVWGTAATLTNVSDDGLDLTGTYTATATCTGACGWIEVEIHQGSTTLLLQSPTENVSLESTALMALDISRAAAAARHGASGLLPGIRPDLDAAVPNVVSAMVSTLLAEQHVGIAGGGPPQPGTDVFTAVDDALADASITAPNLPESAPDWSLTTLDVPTGAKLVVWAGNAVSLPLTPDASNVSTWHHTTPAATEEIHVFRFLFEDGRQSPATVQTRSPSTSTPNLQINDGTNDSIEVTGATSGNWVMQRSNTASGVQGACLADSSGKATLSVDQTSSFTVLEALPNLSIIDYAICDWNQGSPLCD